MQTPLWALRSASVLPVAPEVPTQKGTVLEKKKLMLAAGTEICCG